MFRGGHIVDREGVLKVVIKLENYRPSYHLAVESELGVGTTVRVSLVRR